MAGERPIGYSFIPTAEAAAEGPRRAGLEGDVGEAFKVLSLRLPQNPSVRGIAPNELLTSLGSAGIQGNNQGFNPIQAVFKALLEAGAGGPTNPLSPAMPTAPVIGPGSGGSGGGGSAPGNDTYGGPPIIVPEGPLFPTIITGLDATPGVPSPIKFGGY